jgi:hypothetical protein
LAWSASPSAASFTRILVERPMICGSAVATFGSWCCTMMKAIPASGETLPITSMIGSRPPAEAPMPTTGKTEAAESAFVFRSGFFCLLDVAMEEGHLIAASVIDL